MPLITSPAEFPGTVHMGRMLVFPRSVCLTPFTTQQDSIKNDHPPRSQSIKEMVLMKNGYRFIFPKGKYTEVLNSKKSKNFNIYFIPFFSQQPIREEKKWIYSS